MTEKILKEKILEMVNSGNVTPQEGLRLLKAIEVENCEDRILNLDSPEIKKEKRNIEKRNENVKGLFWKFWWSIPLTFGLVITIFSSFMLISDPFQYDWKFWVSLIILFFGLVSIIFSVLCINSFWIRLFIQENEGNKKTKINISLPIPTIIAKFLLNLLSKFIPQLNKLNLNEIINEIINARISGDAFYVKVREEDTVVDIELL